jgi:hypothetical protein
MLTTFFLRKKTIFLDQATISSNLAKAKTLKARVDKFFNLDQFIDLFKITTDIQDSIGTTQQLSPFELEMYQTLIVWGRNKEGYNRAPIGIIPSAKTIYIGGVKDLPLDTLENYCLELIRDIGVMFDLKEHYQPMLQDVLELIILNLEALEKQ